MSVCLSVVCVYKLTRSARIRSRVLLFLLCALFKRRRRRRPSSSAWLFSLTVLVGLFYKSKEMAHETRHTWRLRRVETCATHSSSSFKLLFYQHNFSSWMKRRKMDTTITDIYKKGKENLWLLLLVGISLRQEWVWCCFVYCYTPSSLDVTDSCFFHSYFHLFFFFFFFYVYSISSNAVTCPFFFFASISSPPSYYIYFFFPQ